MSNVTTSSSWLLHPGDLVVAEITGGHIRILHRTPSDLEAERLVAEANGPGREIAVFKFLGKA